MLFYPANAKKASRLIESLKQRQQIRSAEHTQFFRAAHGSLSYQYLQIILEPQLNRGSADALLLLLPVYYNPQFIAVSLHAVPCIMPTARTTSAADLICIFYTGM